MIAVFRALNTGRICEVIASNAGGAACAAIKLIYCAVLTSQNQVEAGKTVAFHICKTKGAGLAFVRGGAVEAV